MHSAPTALLALSLTLLWALALADIPPSTPYVTSTVDEGDVTPFPNRDFVSVTGYATRKDQPARIVLWRKSGTTWKVVGAARGKFSGTDLAIECNHPGGVCWGAGEAATLQVTPIMRAGDVVQLTTFVGTAEDVLAEVEIGSGTCSNPPVSAVKQNSAGGYAYIQLFGTVGSEFKAKTAQTEVRIINQGNLRLIATPSTSENVLGDPANAGWAWVPSAYTQDTNKAGEVYYQSLNFFDAGATLKWVATFRFNYATYTDQSGATAVAQTWADNAVAVGRGARFMSWVINTPVPAHITIVEATSTHGPMAGCPTGPTDLLPPGGTVGLMVDTANNKAVLNWGAQSAMPDQSPVIGYHVELQWPGTAPITNAMAVLIMDPTVTTYTFGISALAPGANLTPSVRAIADGPAGTGTRMGAEFTAAQPSTPTSVQPGTAEATPVISATVDGAACAPCGATCPTDCIGTSLTLACPSGTLFYTRGTAPVRMANTFSADANYYTAPLAVTGPTTFDVLCLSLPTGQTFSQAQYSVSPPTAVTMTPIKLLLPTVGAGSVTLTWQADAAAIASDVPPTSFRLTRYIGKSATGTPDGTALVANVKPWTYTFQGLSVQDYAFTVTALNNGAEKVSNAVTAKPSQPDDKIILDAAKSKADTKQVRLKGTIGRWVNDVNMAVKVGYTTGTTATASYTDAFTVGTGAITEVPDPAGGPSTAAFDLRFAPPTRNWPGLGVRKVWVVGATGGAIPYQGASTPI